MVRDKYVYILCYSEIDERIAVMYAKRDTLDRWKELFYFESESFARSFELLNDDFYFGIGSEIENVKNWHQYEISPDMGNILRIKNIEH